MNKLSGTLMLLLLLSACTSKTYNPFFEEWDTPFGVPPFDNIKTEHYLPAFKQAISDHDKEIQDIVADKQKSDFNNVIEALERSGELLDRVSSVFFNIKEADATPEMDSLASVIYPMVTRHNDDILMNEALFDKIKQVYGSRLSLSLNREQEILLEDTYSNFVRGGAGLNKEEKNRLKEINEKLSSLELNFETNVRNETNDFELLIEKEEDLSGLPATFIAMAADEAKSKDKEGKWIITLQRSSCMPFLQSSDIRELREKVFKAYISRGDNDNNSDNKNNISEQVALRTEKAILLGFPSYAAFVLDNKMAKTPEAVNGLMKQIHDPALEVAKMDVLDMNKLIRKAGGNFSLEAWDYAYYAEKIRKERFNLDESMVQPYFRLENVLQGVFDVSSNLFGIKFNKLNTLPLYHPEAVTYQVTEADGKEVGILYFDFFPRATKSQGAWMTSFRTQSRDSEGNRVQPIVSIVCNFTRPSGEAPALLTMDEVETLFHEFGHGLHGLLSDVTYKSQAGTSVATDFVELPSQIMEHWAFHPEVLKMYAKHYKTGETIPDDLIEKIVKSGTFNQGFNTTELVVASMLDMKYHQRTDISPINDIRTFEKQALSEIGLIREIEPRYKSTYFRHIFTGGYTAGYYSYLWSEVLDADAFESFKEKGIFDKETALSFRKNILERGGTERPMIMYVRFKGAEPGIEPILRNRGLMGGED